MSGIFAGYPGGELSNEKEIQKAAYLFPRAVVLKLFGLKASFTLLKIEDLKEILFM